MSSDERAQQDLAILRKEAGHVDVENNFDDEDPPTAGNWLRGIADRYEALLTDAEQGREVARIATAFGWNGVENSKLLSVFISDELNDLARLRAKVPLIPIPCECPDHLCPRESAYHAVRNGTGMYLCGDCILSTDEHSRPVNA